MSYAAKLLRLLDRGVVTRGELTSLEIRHDRDCPLLRGGAPCTCNAEIWKAGQRLDREVES